MQIVDDYMKLMGEKMDEPIGKHCAFDSLLYVANVFGANARVYERERFLHLSFVHSMSFILWV